jgi:hypothetical protein
MTAFRAIANIHVFEVPSARTERIDALERSDKCLLAQIKSVLFRSDSAPDVPVDAVTMAAIEEREGLGVGQTLDRKRPIIALLRRDDAFVGSDLGFQNEPLSPKLPQTVRNRTPKLDILL